MISEVHLENFAIFEDFRWNELGSINLVIGENDTGKSHLLKLLYTVARSLQEYKQKQSGEAPRWAEVLSDKLGWVFQPPGSPGFNIGKLVRKGEAGLDVTVRIHGEPVHFDFGEDTTKQIRNASASPKPRDEVRTLFFPPKEVLTPRKAIITMREQQGIPGFSDTYYDLARALGHETTRGRTQENLKEVKAQLENLFTGRIEWEDGDFVFKRGAGPKKFSMSQTAEGVKKIGLLTRLIRNRNIKSGSILFFDEPAAHLHPQATLDFVRMLYEMAKADIQLFIATHSYVVLKQFELLARKHSKQMPLCILEPSEGEGVSQSFADLSDHIPSNSIVDASVDLFERDLDLSFSSN